MTNIPKGLRDILSESHTLERAAVSKELISFDETRKWLLKFADGNEAETVYIPEEGRGTVCISSQVGCTLTCKFCHTGTQLLVRNLTAQEIVAQYMLVKDAFNDWPASKEGRRITNIVMMGMGEPLYNYDNVAQALKIIMDDEGLGLSRRKITLSTSGVVPEINRCGEELGVNLAVSLHATTNTLRNEIVPLNKKYNIELLLEACKNYPALKNRGRITFEYVMLKGVNDSIEDAKRLVSLIRDIPSKVNLIPFNSWPDAPYECSDKQAIINFVEYLHKKKVIATVRTTRGDDIYAACGQLKSISERKKKCS